MSVSLVKCEECQIKYPEDLLYPFSVMRDEEINSTLMCGICALKISNRIHGANRRKFNGTLAEKMRKKAIKYRKDHNL